MQWCNNCKEDSMVIRIYLGKGNKKKRAIYCINKGCGRRFLLPFPEEIKEKLESKRV